MRETADQTADQTADLRYEELNGEIVVLDAGAGVVHRLSGDAAEAVRAESDEMSRRRMIGSLIALGVAAGVTTLALPSAAAAASGGGSDPADQVGSSYSPYAGDGIQAPGAVIATAGTLSATVSWSPVSGATRFRVYVRTGGLYPGPWTLGWSGLAQSAVVTALNPGTEYDFTVVTVVGALQSGQSTRVSATPLDGPPSVPQDLAAVVQANDPPPGYMVNLSWQPGDGPTPTGYMVKYRTDPGAEFSETAEPIPFPFLTIFPYEGYIEFQVAARRSTFSSAYSYPFTLDEREG